MGRTATATATATREVDARSARQACLYLLLECRRPAAGGARWALDDVDEVLLGRGEDRQSSRERGSVKTLSIALPDHRMSTKHARLVRLATGWAFEDLGSKNGSRIGGNAIKHAPLQPGDVIEIGETLFLFEEEQLSVTDLREPAGAAPGLLTLSPSLARSHAELVAVAKADVPVLIQGETGTGKELAARALHQLSGRKGRFVAVNCGALPQNLIEAELFGHRHGAFSGSVESRVGLIRSADRGTLFLDEIGDLPLASQAALLRVLQEKEVTGVGETSPTPVDLRVVAATHHDLRALCEKGKFRLDLLARLEGYVAHLPPLRERRCDFGVLMASLLERIAPAKKDRLSFQAQAARALVSYDWPTNIRELEQLLRATIAIASDDAITFALLPERIRNEPTAKGGPSSRPVPSDEQLSPEDAALKAQISALLQEHRGSINGVARAMNKDRTQIRRWLARFGLDADRFR